MISPGLLEAMTSLVLPFEPDMVLLRLDILLRPKTRSRRVVVMQIVKLREGYRNRN